MAVEASVSRGLAKVGDDSREKLWAHDERIGGVEQHVGSVFEKLHELEQVVESLQTDLAAQQGRLQELQARVLNVCVCADSV